MALSLLRARLCAGTGRSCATGVVKAAVASSGGGGYGNLTMIRRFSAGSAGNYTSGETTFRYAAIFLGLAAVTAGWSCAVVPYAISGKFSRPADQEPADKSSSQAETTKAGVLLRYVDKKLSESARSTKSSQDEAKAEVLRYVDEKLSESARSAKPSQGEVLLLRYVDDVLSESARSNRLMLSQWRAADERKLAGLGKEIASIRLELRAANSELSQLRSRAVASEGNNDPPAAECAGMRQELRSIEWYLKSALSQLNCSTAQQKSGLSQLQRRVDGLEETLNQLVGKQEKHEERLKKEKMD